MKKLLGVFLALLAVSSVQATEVIFHNLGKVSQLDTASRSVSYVIPYEQLYTNFRVNIKFKGKTYKKASANFYLVYIKEN